MKKQFLVIAALAFFFSCTGKSIKPKYMDEKNEAKYSPSRAMAEPPEKVLRAAHAVLDELTKESNPATTEPVKKEDDAVFTGWVYGLAKDKYVQYDYNGAPRRKQLALRRIYGITVRPTLAGSQVDMEIEEEIQEIDLKTGKPEGWDRVETDPAAYDLLLRRLREKVRSE